MKPLGLSSVKRVSAFALTVMMTALLAGCDSGQPATTSGAGSMDVSPPPVPDGLASQEMKWTWENQNLEGWELSALPMEVTWPAGGGISIVAPSEPEYPDIFMRSPPVSFSGEEFTRVVVDLETVVPGVQPDLSLYYSTPSQVESYDARGVPGDYSLPEAGERRLLVYDMTMPADGSTTWVDNMITSIRFDLPQGANSHHIVHSIRVCRTDDADCG